MGETKGFIPVSNIRPAVFQTTLGDSISCTGVGLHSGSEVSMTLCPAPANTGIQFRRTDVDVDDIVSARFDSVVDTQLGTTVANEAGVRVLTIEHLMAAFAGCGIDNAIVELNAEEVPIMDGSAAPFVFLIECAGSRELGTPRRVLRIKRPVRVGDTNRYATLTPADEFHVDLVIDFPSAVIGRQHHEVRLVNGAFKSELARARTFGFLKDVETLQAMGLARGGSLDNSIVVDGDMVLNDDGLRCDDEFVRHKLLDVVGDLATAGWFIEGHFEGALTGHALNNELLQAVFSDPDNYEITEARLPEAGFKAAASAAQ